VLKISFKSKNWNCYRPKAAGRPLWSGQYRLCAVTATSK